MTALFRIPWSYPRQHRGALAPEHTALISKDLLGLLGLLENRHKMDALGVGSLIARGSSR